MRFFILRLGICLLLAHCAIAQEAAPAEAAFQKARDAKTQGDLKGALESYNTAIELEDRWQFRLERGLLQLQLGDSRAAADDFDRVVNTIPATNVGNLYFKALALSNRTLARQNIRRQMHPDLEDYEAALEIARGIVAMKDADPSYISAGQHLIGVTLVLEAELLSEQNHLQDALTKLKEALPNIPQSDHHWLCQAYLDAGKIAIDGPGWRQALEQLHLAVREAQMAGEAAEQARALIQIVGAERDPQKQSAAVEELKALSFAALPDPDYWDAWRTVHLAAHLSDLGDWKAVRAEIEKVAGSEQVRQHADLSYDLLFPRAHLAIAANDGPALEAAEREAEEILKPLEPGSSMAMEVRILQIEMAAHKNEFKQVLALSETVQKQLFETLGDQPSNLAAFPSRDLAFVLHTLADTYLDMGMLPQGLDLLRRSISLLQELKLEREENAEKIEYAHFWSLIDPAGKQDSQGKPEWRRALDEMAPSLGSLDPELKNFFHLVYAVGSFGANDIKGAKEHLATIDRTIIREDQKAQLFMLEAAVDLKQDNLDGALTALSVVESHADDLSPVERISSLALGAEVLRKRGSLSDSLEKYHQAINMSEGLSAQSPDVNFQASLRDPEAPLYEEAIETELALERQNPQRQSDELLELVLRAIVPPRPIERMPTNADLHLILNRLAVHRMIFALWPEFHQAHPSIVQENEDFRAAFRRDYARYFSMLPQAQGNVIANRHLRALSFLRERSQAPGHQVRLYYLGSKGGILFIFENGRARRPFIIAPAAVKQVRALASGWKDAIVALDDQQEAARGTARKLLAILFPEGWQNTPAGIEVVAHEELWDVAFETLITSRPGAPEVRYLDQERSITYLTPVTLSRATKKSTRSTADTGFFFISPSISAADVDPVPTDPKLREAFINLGIPRNHIFEGQEASERKLYSDAIQHSRWLYFLTHSAPENNWEDHVGLLLTADSDAAKTHITYERGSHALGLDTNIDFRGDGFLSPRDIETMDLWSEFVFLHGCQTAHGTISFSSGLLGLISAFLAAGSESVIASHWNVAVRDEVSGPVAAFYGDFLKSEQPVDETLRRLRANIRSQSAFGRHPYAWAAFSVYR
jgi:tetratricopeptide (TPR) repeat protein